MELEIAKRTLATREDSLRLIRVRQQGGVATMLDVRQAEQLVYSAAADHSRHRAADRADREPDQPAAGQRTQAP